MNRVCIKGKNGEYEEKIWDEQSLTEWFKKNSDRKGNVQSEIIVYEKCSIGKSKDDDGFEFTFSDYSLDRDQERIDPAGWDLKNYKKNPVVLWGHDWKIPAIGKAENVKADADRLTGKVIFDMEDPHGALIARKVKNGFLTSGSVGFMPKVIEIVDDKERPEWYIHRQQELMEFSIVNVPSNTSATRRDPEEPGESKAQKEPWIKTLFRETSQDGDTSQPQNKGNTGLNNLFKGEENG